MLKKILYMMIPIIILTTIACCYINASADEVYNDKTTVIDNSWKKQEMLSMYLKAKKTSFKEVKCEEDTFSDEDVFLLEKIAVAEANNQGIECMATVIRTVLNRVDDNRFPNNIEDVIYQEGQFTPIIDGRFYEVEPNGDSAEAIQMVINGWDESYGALFFESCEGSSWHSENLELVTTIGDMRFYR